MAPQKQVCSCFPSAIDESPASVSLIFSLSLTCSGRPTSMASASSRHTCRRQRTPPTTVHRGCGPVEVRRRRPSAIGNSLHHASPGEEVQCWLWAFYLSLWPLPFGSYQMEGPRIWIDSQQAQIKMMFYDVIDRSILSPQTHTHRGRACSYSYFVGITCRAVPPACLTPTSGDWRGVVDHDGAGQMEREIRADSKQLMVCSRSIHPPPILLPKTMLQSVNDDL